VLPADQVLPAVPAAREVAVAPAVPVVPVAPAARAVAVVTTTEAVVDRVVLAAPEVLAAPVDPAAPEDPAVAVGSAPVGAETPLVRSASRAVVRPEVESPSAPSVKSSTTWKPRRSAAFGCLEVRVKRSGSRAVRH